MSFVQVDSAKLDRELTRRQAELVAEQLREEEREMAARIVDGLLEQLAATERDLEEVRADLAARAPKKPGRVKTSGGKDHASARGTINSSGKAVHGQGWVAGRGISPPKAKAPAEHKHDYAPESGRCTKFTNGIRCEAVRQRKARAPKQTVIPGTDGAKGSEATP